MGPWEVQYNRGVPLCQLASDKAKAPPSPKSRVREGEVQQRMEPDWDAYVMDFDSYPAQFALTSEAQSDVALRLREDTERNAPSGREAIVMGSAASNPVPPPPFTPLSRPHLHSPISHRIYSFIVNEASNFAIVWNFHAHSSLLVIF